MNISEAQNLVVKAGIHLVESGLIARTWGNVSCRLDADHFVITPSGRDYLSLTSADIVTVKISDCSYNGSIKPSSEKGIHAEVYKLHPDVNFVIHTHQDQASVISASELESIKVPDYCPDLGGEVLIAAYALPGTKKLRRNVALALSRSKGQAVIMKNHGALCFGRDYDNTFQAAADLENACREYVINKYLSLSHRDSFASHEMIDFALSSLVRNEGNSTDPLPKPFKSSQRTGRGFRLYDETGTEIEVVWGRVDASVYKEAALYDAIYRKYKNINHMVFISTPEVLALSSSGISLRPLLDDFAQIAGPAAKTVSADMNQVLPALKRSSVVLVKNRGALCCGITHDDAVAVGMVTQKACQAYIGALLFGKIKPINPLECMLMRFVYQNTYSKKK